MKNTKNYILLVIGLIVLVIFSIEISGTIIRQRNDLLAREDKYLMVLAEKEAQTLESDIKEVGFYSTMLSYMISTDAELNFEKYDEYIRSALLKDPSIFGIGYWFEPYYVDPEMKYFGPYIYRDEQGVLVQTMMYSTQDYDYLSWNWYIEGISSEGSSHFTRPYYDESLETFFMTISEKIVKDDLVVGIASVDITLREVQDHINSIQIGEEGSAFIITSDGLVMGEDQLYDSKQDGESSFQMKQGIVPNLEQIMCADEADSTMKNGFITVWAPVSESDLKVVFCYPENEVMAEIYQSIWWSVLIFIAAMILFMFALNYALKRLIEKPLRNILKYNYEYDVQVQPNFKNMIQMIKQLLRERNESIEELNEKNIELEGMYQQTAAMNDTLNQFLEEIRKGYIATVRSLSNAIEAKDEYTKGHCERVTKYALLMGMRFNIDQKGLDSLEYAAILHDIGKIGLSDVVLNKPGKLTDEEYEIIKKHPFIGHEILKDIEFLEGSLDMVLHHHERVDGKGYPDGLSGMNISLSTKILMVADAYDAMTSSRPYRKEALSENEAISILKQYSGTQFDGEVVEVFIDMLKSQCYKDEK